MELKGILSISGYTGLYKLLTQTKRGIIVESLTTKKRMQAFATSKISALEDIAIYTDDSEVPLYDVLKKIHEKEQGGKTINHKSSGNELKKYFGGILSGYDKDKVYVSDMKRVFNWYNILHGLEMLNFEEKEEETPKDEVIGDETSKNEMIEESNEKVEQIKE